MYDNGLYASGLKEVDEGSMEPAGKGSFWRAASILEVVGVTAIICCGRTSKALKDSCPGIGDRVKYCCCITGSTEAATEFVDSATLLRTFTAIQSLKHFMIRNLFQMNDVHLLKEQFQDLECTESRIATNGQVPHNLARNVSPTDKDAPRTHLPSLLWLIRPVAAH